MPKVFISHSWEDNAISHQIAEYLKSNGAEIWIDYARISGGESLPRQISDALEWCDTLILLWSKAAKKSEWVNLEWENAISLKKRIIPCLLDSINLPGILSRCLYIDFRDPETGCQKLAWDLNLSDNKKVLSIFRSEPQELSLDNVKVMLKKYDFYCREYDWSKSYCNPNGRGFEHQYQPQTIQGDRVVIDQTSGLMWQQGGSDESMPYADAEKWIQALNRRGYAGFKDWRLSTLEEAMSLMEGEKKNDDLYLTPIFDKIQLHIWTTDQVVGSTNMWIVDFSFGGCISLKIHNEHYVHAVRSRLLFQEIEQASSELKRDSNLTIKKESLKLESSHNVMLTVESKVAKTRKDSIFRNTCISLSHDSVEAMLRRRNFFDSKLNKSGIGYKHNFEQQMIQSDLIIIDWASELMWQQEGSSCSMSYENARKWVADLNQNGYAGFNDWRLPTLEEAMSLVESKQQKYNLYINSDFDMSQQSIWTCDYVAKTPEFWVVCFDIGHCFNENDINSHWIRLVRSISQ